MKREYPRILEVAMSIDHVFPGVQDFLVLTSQGLIGRFEPGDGFRVFKRLSASVGEYSKRLLQAYQETPDSSDICPAILIPPMPTRKWHSASLVLDDNVLHRLFPSGGGVAPTLLTPFQSRNRERSIYQGMELLIAYENKSMPDVAFYCPVLFGQGRKLIDYPRYAGLVADDVPRDTPVIEVLNFIALLNPTERRSEWAKDLVRLIQDISIQKGRRAASPLTIKDI